MNTGACPPCFRNVHRWSLCIVLAYCVLATETGLLHMHPEQPAFFVTDLKERKKDYALGRGLRKGMTCIM